MTGGNCTLKIYFAPMEGMTGYIYRNAFQDYYGKGIIDQYFMPFISPNNKGFTAKERADIDPVHNENIPVVPQILTNQEKFFIGTSKALKHLGYSQVNLNLGCPSGTVVSKYKGAGFLAKPEELDRFFDQIFSDSLFRPSSNELAMGVTVKTRLGLEDTKEFNKILQIYNRYPLQEIIIHPRVRKDYYKNQPDMEAYGAALSESRHPVCYNGDIFTVEDYKRLIKEYPSTNAVMLGRGLIADPGLIKAIEAVNHGKTSIRDIEKEQKQLKAFHDRIYQDYMQIMSGDKNAIYKMKELWSYMKYTFTQGEKPAKQIKKAQKAADYENAVNGMFMQAKLEIPKELHFWS
jgi:tRNA-dihydrouridine synthase